MYSFVNKTSTLGSTQTNLLVWWTLYDNHYENNNSRVRLYKQLFDGLVDEIECGIDNNEVIGWITKRVNTRFSVSSTSNIINTTTGTDSSSSSLFSFVYAFDFYNFPFINIVHSLVIVMQCIKPTLHKVQQNFFFANVIHIVNMCVSELNVRSFTSIQMDDHKNWPYLYNLCMTLWVQQKVENFYGTSFSIKKSLLTTKYVWCMQ